MVANTKIEWCDATFNPWEGCTKVGPGCDNCYAENRNARFAGGEALNWGPAAPRRRTSVSNWSKPIQWNEAAAEGRFVQCVCGHREFRKWDTTIPPGGLACCSNPQCTALPESESFAVRPRVFCASLADVFDNEVDPNWRLDLFKLITETPHLDWLLLTKRIGNAHKMLQEVAPHFDAMLDSNDRYRPLPNVWLGATVVNQEEADRDIPKLLQVPARVRWLSMEPLLGPVNLGKWLDKPHCPTHDTDGGFCLQDCGDWRRLNWVVVGGESGPGARPMHPDWARSLRDQCVTAGVPFLFKQWGEHLPEYDRDRDDPDFRACNEWGRKPGRWINLAGGHGFHGDRVHYAHRIGKKRAGRLLDGRTWDQFPGGAS